MLLRHAQLPVFYAEQALLERYRSENAHLGEVQRITNVRLLHDEWMRCGFSEELLPYVHARDDYWYLVQLFALGRHQHSNGTAHAFSLAREQQLWTEEAFESQELFQALSKKAGWQEATPMTRTLIEDALEVHQEKVLTDFDFSPVQYELRLPYLDELARLAAHLHWKAPPAYIPVAGERVHHNGKRYGIIASHQSYGGFSFVDCWWNDQPLTALFPKLVIVPRSRQ